MASRPTEITEEDFDGGTDIQGLPWGVWDIPVKEDFREKRYPLHPQHNSPPVSKTTAP